MSPYPKSLKKLISALEKLPGIGPKTAERFALYLTHSSPHDGRILMNALAEAEKTIIHCDICFNVADTSPCFICENKTRDQKTICVVSSPPEVLAFERSGEFKGAYHVLQGVLNPLDGINPEHIKIKELLTRIERDEIREVILGINPTVEGELTSTYITKLLNGKNIIITRIARGLPMGASVEYADDATLANALKERKKI